MTVPVEMPGLIPGAGETPERGACVMQAVAWLATNGTEWTDAPACTNRVLARVAINVNDNVTDTARHQLWPLVPRLMGTATGDRKTDIRIGIALAAWAAERVLPLIKDKIRHARAAERISHARAWLDQGKPPAYATATATATATAYATAAAYAATATAYAAAAYATTAATAAAAAAYAAAAYATAAYATADYAAYAAAAYATTADAAGSRIQFLTDLLDEYDRITGRTAPAQITTAQWTALHDALTGQTADA